MIFFHIVYPWCILLVLPRYLSAAVDGDASRLLTQPIGHDAPRIVRVAPPFSPSFNTSVSVVEVHYSVGPRMKRCFVGWHKDAHGQPTPATARALLVALPGSNSDGNGAMDIISGLATPWPVLACARTGAPFVAIDLPLFGAYPYQPAITIDGYRPSENGALAQLLDNVHGIKAAQSVLQTRGISNTDVAPKFVGGHSWGAVAAIIVAGAMPEVTGLYASSPYIDTEHDQRPFMAPPEWIDAGWNYSNVLAETANRARIRLTFGPLVEGPGKAPTLLPDADYMAFGVDEAILWRLVHDTHGSLSVHRHATGHTLDTEDFLAFFDDYMRSLP